MNQAPTIKRLQEKINIGDCHHFKGIGAWPHFNKKK